MNNIILSIIIPAYNEEKRIERTLEEYGKFFRELKKSGKIGGAEILVVINNTKDRTEEIVKNYQKRYEEIRFLNFKQGGKGFAITEGFKDALKRKNNLIGFVDADMATSPKDFYYLVKNINGYDGIIASRAIKGSKADFSLKRKITHRGFNFIVRSLLLLPYSDTQCGAKIFYRYVLEKVINEIGTTKWAYDVDLLYRIKKRGFKIKEHPTIWEDKRGSKIDIIKTTIQMFLGVLRLRILNSPFRGIIKLYSKLPENFRIEKF